MPVDSLQWNVEARGIPEAVWWLMKALDARERVDMSSIVFPAVKYRLRKWRQTLGLRVLYSSVGRGCRI